MRCLTLCARQNKTVLRTVRISKDLDGVLEKDARVYRTSVNGLISSIMEKYAEWDRYTERFGHISIPTRLFRAILDLIDENALATLAEQTAVELTSQLILFWFKQISLENMLQYLSHLSEYGKMGEVEVENEGRDYTISIYHEYGKKWSTWLERYIDQVIRAYLKTAPQFQTTGNTITVKFQAPVDRDSELHTSEKLELLA